MNSAIEVRLNLLRPEKGGNAVTISVINKSNENIYLPNFSLFAALSGLHCYEKQPTGYREINLTFHMYQDDFEKNNFEETSIRNDRNETSSQLNRKMSAVFNEQKNIARTYCLQNNITKQTNGPLYYSLMSGSHDAVFLKANDTLGICNVVPIDFLFDKQADYKLAFNSEPKDSLAYNFRTGDVLGEPNPFYPENIMGYKRFHGNGVVSNIIYFSTKDAAPPKNKATKTSL